MGIVQIGDSGTVVSPEAAAEVVRKFQNRGRYMLDHWFIAVVVDSAPLPGLTQPNIWLVVRPC